jgi:BirA family biotin operon repressor/biotin-[acetyl-CoA-carboxylase] ligase
MAFSIPSRVAAPVAGACAAGVIGEAATGLGVPALLRLLADGRLHSGEWLAQQLGVSRAAIWKAVERLRHKGIDIRATHRRGYALACAVELLEEGRVRAAVSSALGACIERFDLTFDVDSTNSRLLATVPPQNGRVNVALTELQHAGRGRRGRHWVAPFGGSLALSLGWVFADASRATPALSLCVGVAVARALARCGADAIALKWPNDIWLADAKVGGVLLELRAEASGPAYVVIGVGLNVSLSPAERRRFEESGVRVASVADACSAPPSRNFIAGALIAELLGMLSSFERDGFAAFRDEWTSLDALRNRPSRVLIGENAVSGIARGVSADGALRLERDGRIQEFMSGEVSLRLDGDEN